MLPKQYECIGLCIGNLPRRRGRFFFVALESLTKPSGTDRNGFKDIFCLGVLSAPGSVFPPIRSRLLQPATCLLLFMLLLLLLTLLYFHFCTGDRLARPLTATLKVKTKYPTLNALLVPEG